MPPSAAPPVKQSYSAGNCRLDLTIQPSALSQWHPQLIAKQVEFKLWIDEENAAPRLLAEGDRTSLQAIAQHIEHRTQALLTVSQISRANSKPTAPPSLPKGTQLPHPLSYLQLSDLSTVLTQSEQAYKVLPEAAIVTSQTVRTVATDQAVVSLQTPSPAASNRRGNLIFFPTGRRAAWASSAAAALFAVGLTTVLWDRTTVPETASIAETDLAIPNDSDTNERLRLGRSQDEQLSAARPSGRTPIEFERSPRQTAQNPTTATQNTQEQNAAAGQNSAPTGNPSPSSPPTNNPATSSPSASGSASSAPSTAPTTSPGNTAVRESIPSPAAGTFDSASQESLQTNESTNTPADASSATAPASASRPAPNNALDRKLAANAEADTEALDPATLIAPDSETLTDLEPAREPARKPASPQAPTSITNSGVDRASAPSPEVAEAVPSSEAIAQQEAETLAQVQTYFENRWRPAEDLSASLIYQLQLSSLGKVISFAALAEIGKADRDRLTPSRPFPPSNSAALPNGITLKITLKPNGQVQVENI